MNNILKYTTIIFFIGFIFIVPIITLITPDKKISELENKILTSFPELSFKSIKSKRFMKNFDTYSSDQFPLRTNFIKIKNSYSYFIGNREFRNIYIGKNNRLMEKFVFNKDIIDKNISQTINLSNFLNYNYNIKSKLAIIPTSIAFYKDYLPNYALSDSQTDALKFIGNNLKSTSLSFYTPYNILNENKDKYIYFYTDHHWTQLGAKLTYEDMYKTKVSNDSYNKVSDNFYGTYYSKAIFPKIKSDSIYAYQEFNKFNIRIDLFDNFNTLYDKSKLTSKNKYQYFLHGDPAIAVIEGNKNINKEILIFKDSYAHNFTPFLTNNYSKIHIIDPRYYSINLNDYLDENSNISEALFINNIQTFNNENLYKKVNFNNIYNH